MIKFLQDQLVELEIEESLESPLREGDKPCLFIQVSPSWIQTSFCECSCYIQARFQNEFNLWSNWSEPTEVAKNSSYLVECGLAEPENSEELIFYSKALYY